MQKLFKGGNYSKAKTIRGNTVYFHQKLSFVTDLLRSFEKYMNSKLGRSPHKNLLTNIYIISCHNRSLDYKRT